MRRGRRTPLLVQLYAVGVYAAGFVTLAGLVRWGWPVADAFLAGMLVSALSCAASLWAGRTTTRRRADRQRRRG